MRILAKEVKPFGPQVAFAAQVPSPNFRASDVLARSLIDLRACEIEGVGELVSEHSNGRVLWDRPQLPKGGGAAAGGGGEPRTPSC